MEERRSFNSVDKLTSWQVDKLVDSGCEVVWSLKPESEATLESENLKLLSALLNSWTPSLLILDERLGIRDEGLLVKLPLQGEGGGRGRLYLQPPSYIGKVIKKRAPFL